MLEVGSTITLHFIDNMSHTTPTEFRTRATGQIFTVKKEGGKLGFDGNTNRSPYTCRGELFTPFAAYAWAVIFRDEETGHLYQYSNIYNGLEDVTGLEDGYIDKIVWLS